jgi:hypothetical protein
MRNVIAFLAAAWLVTSVSILSCNDTSSNDETAQNNVTDSTKIKDSINTAYMKDMANYKKQTVDKISSNDTIIEGIKAKFENGKSDVKAGYKKSIAELEQKNAEMKKRLINYKAEGKSKWEIFKIQFNHDMDDLGNEFKKLTAKL